VSNHRLDVHVSKGFDDGLHISSVCACGDLWAIIMDAGTGFSQQVGGAGRARARAFLRCLAVWFGRPLPSPAHQQRGRATACIAQP
jgi:hypothetical protein